MKIRKALIKDIEFVQKLHNELYKYENKYIDLYNMEWSFSEEAYLYFKSRVEKESGTILVVEIDSEIVGYICGGMGNDNYRSKPKFAEIDSLYISEKQRGKGIGDELITKFIDWAKGMGALRIKLEAVNVNDGAVRFYERKGFKPTYLELEYNIN